MESLGIWNVTGEGQFPKDAADEMRQDVADWCEYMLGTTKGTIDKECFDGVDTIIHLSGEKISKIWTDKTKMKLYDSRILTTKFLYNSVRDLKLGHKIKSFICASAIGIYKSDFEIKSPILNSTSPILHRFKLG